MKRSRIALLLSLVACAAAQEPSTPAPPVAASGRITLPADFRWTPNPADSTILISVLQGDLQAEGVYTMRVTYPAGFATEPHWHPLPEYAVVLSGSFYLGFGREASRESMTLVPPGAFIEVPPGVPHYSWNPDEVVMHVYGIGPRATHWR